MKRRKKSILFSATLATAGLVAGSLIAINNNTISAESIRAMSLDQLTDILSNELKVSTESLSSSLNVKEIIVQTDDENVLKNDPLIASYGTIRKNFYGVNYNSAHDAAASYYLLSKNDAVKNIALSYKVTVSSTTPSDPNKQSYGVGMMRLDRYAQDLSSSTNELKIAVIDSGINENHELFSENSSKDRLDLSDAISFVDADENCSYTMNYADEHFHGTAVSGLIAQSTPKNVKIIPIRVFDGSGESNSLYSILCGANYAAQVAPVANMSLGADLGSNPDVPHSTIDALNAFFDDLVDEHHTIEDTALALGECVLKALGDKRGIERYGYCLPMDDCLCQVALDFGGRPWLVWDAEFKRERIGEMPTEMFLHFFKIFSDSARMNLNIKAEGENEHHKIEGIFKALARSLRMAVRRDVSHFYLPSSKGVL